ncbi:dienelactone hydrolase family protein [Bythopirellula goksoeyrii]|uniref:Alpha/beta hydrolase family protein n=1 Tax=Bythopirellula goksoeyrii TaxID=1400387 RepID=A0A5B9Q6Q9_9BACT|nr:alpha/beta hydrolase family protein [Bythopirellula goksoeyrii]QEG33215.1 Alpha/beta hydrolase family protein [Bythopirellula goksoeyrii]
MFTKAVFHSSQLFALLLALSTLVAKTEGEQRTENESQLMEFSVTPAASGRQLVRASIPFRSGILSQTEQVFAEDGSEQTPVAVRPLGFHIDSTGEKTVRQAMVTFPYNFLQPSPTVFRLHKSKDSRISLPKQEVELTFHGEGWWEIAYSTGSSFRAVPIWPDSEPSSGWISETVEQSPYFIWQRWKQEIGKWHRIVEFRTDHLGQVIAVAHLQRLDASSNWAPRFGWEITPLEKPSEKSEISPFVTRSDREWQLSHSFAAGGKFEDMIDPGRIRIAHPAAPYKQSGGVFTRQLDSGSTAYRYLRSTPSERVPMQEYSWRRAEMVISPVGVAPVTATLQSAHKVSIKPIDWNASYGSGLPITVDQHLLLSKALEFHRQATVRMAAVGHDWGNVTTFSDSTSHGGIFGMNRLNHAPGIIFEAMRTGDRQFLEIGLAWCDNFHDLSIWWGPKDFGGTRYNNIRANNDPTPEDDTTFMWRGDKSTTFCTKGYAAFQMAYELTGDPRMSEALESQVAYAVEHVHSNDGECRNIGDVADFVKLYELTGEQRFLDHGLRLFRELRPLLSPDYLFDQGGKQLAEDPPFIDGDDRGFNIGYAKPYIIGYGLAGCPQLAKYFPDEPGLQEMARAMADFLIESQDPLGGWRYPHPASSRTMLGQAMEHANQLVETCKLLGPQEKYLDAIERVLRQRVWILEATGTIANNLVGWETATGFIGHPKEIYDLYQFPGDRDSKRDYREGNLRLGSAPPEALVYFPKVLRYYLAHRSVVRLLEQPREETPLGQLLAATTKFNFPANGKASPTETQTKGVDKLLPVFSQDLKSSLEFPSAWEHATNTTFDEWKTKARRQVREAFLTPPSVVDFNPKVLDSQKQDGYTSQKIELNLSGESRVLAYLLIPDGKGPFPAVLMLHDHGAEFRIGKEKLVHAWDISAEKQRVAEQWVEKYYGGRYLGDELAKRGYVCLATDALNWSDRGGGGFEGQQALSSNLMHMGMSLAGLIAHEDLRAAEFLASLPEVDSDRVASLGLSMGSFRAWQVAAMSDHIAAGAAICWMATVKGLMQPGNNQTKGHSAYTMLHPGLLNLLDYPDIASLACPKPMLFYNGLQDSLFPVPSVEKAYRKLHSVWSSQRHEELLETRLWDVPHVFNLEMQDKTFQWLDRQFKFVIPERDFDAKSAIPD